MCQVSSQYLQKYKRFNIFVGNNTTTEFTYLYRALICTLNKNGFVLIPLMMQVQNIRLFDFYFKKQNYIKVETKSSLSNPNQKNIFLFSVQRKYQGHNLIREKSVCNTELSIK